MKGQNLGQAYEEMKQKQDDGQEETKVNHIEEANEMAEAPKPTFDELIQSQDANGFWDKSAEPVL